MTKLEGAVKTTPELVAEFERLNFRKVPVWLGHFAFRVFKLSNDKLPNHIASEVDALTKLAPPQDWNTVFVQRYFPGEGVRPHRACALALLGYMVTCLQYARSRDVVNRTMGAACVQGTIARKNLVCRLRH